MACRSEGRCKEEGITNGRVVRGMMQGISWIEDRPAMLFFPAPCTGLRVADIHLDTSISHSTVQG
jgi:hypothetical protein